MPLLLLIVFFSFTTLTAYVFKDLQGGGTVNWHRVLELFDLREENSVATWFSSSLFLTTALGFGLLGWGQSVHYFPGINARYLYRLTAFALILVSADEVGSVHETVGSWFERKIILWEAGKGMGFSWLILFAPFALLLLFTIFYHLSQLIRQLPTLTLQTSSKTMLYVATFSLVGVLLLEGLEGYFILINAPNTILPCFEEILELVGMYSLFLVTIYSAKQFYL